MTHTYCLIYTFFPRELGIDRPHIIIDEKRATYGRPKRF